MGKFKKGLFLGGLLGAGLMWLNATTKGKEVRSKMMVHLEPLFNELKNNIKQLEGPTKEMWDALVERAVEEYAVKKDIAVEVKNSLLKNLKKKWNDLEEDIRNK